MRYIQSRGFTLGQKRNTSLEIRRSSHTKLRHDLGESYVETLHTTFDELPSNIDYVMCWWHIASQLVAHGRVKRFGFITTNSITQVKNRQVVRQFLVSADESALAFVVPDHPWVDSVFCAAVRIAMSDASCFTFDPGVRRESLVR